MKTYHFPITVLLTLLLSCSSAPATAPTTDCDQSKNEALILGTIHSGHLTDSVYNIAHYWHIEKPWSYTDMRESDS